jgi:predicted nucleotidyltransferase
MTRWTDGRGYNAAVRAADDSLLEALTAEPKVRLAVLFGSEARGKADAASDLDVGVAGPDASELPALALRLERATGRPIDLVGLTTAPPLLRFEIARDGRVLVQQAPHLWSDFKSRAMVDWWDWAPIARRFHAAATARLRRQVTDGPT